MGNTTHLKLLFASDTFSVPGPNVLVVSNAFNAPSSSSNKNQATKVCAFRCLSGPFLENLEHRNFSNKSSKSTCAKTCAPEIANPTKPCVAKTFTTTHVKFILFLTRTPSPRIEPRTSRSNSSSKATAICVGATLVRHSKNLQCGARSTATEKLGVEPELWSLELELNASAANRAATRTQRMVVCVVSEMRNTFPERCP